ncbi:branched-chain amino acid ABC transporter permease [Halanaerobiaceae bacterium Z-7014]|uniref:Branched-chain amino acid ABC transporter permease n=1 Tax=Halonatronomonas betaini TaxID=2778430 RepID=A0A931F820_9FIRM|nr:branched-chain amino acid ABC transporter permease [Halonatronomonas betaini]MBF8436078.1 branched-chain amino acid ABC transporter permease [Halonatronomonas betaini]
MFSPQVTLTILNGLTQAGLLFLIASGLTLAFGLMQVVNLAHGAFYLLGGFIGYSVFRATSIWWLAVIAGGLGIAIIGFFMERILLEKIRGNMLSETLLTIGISTVIADIVLFIWGGRPLSIQTPEFLNPRLNIFGVRYPGFRVFILFLSIAVGTILWFILFKTQLGAMIRAGVDDREMVAALGINIRKLFTLVFLLSAFLAGAAGVVGGTYLSLQIGTDVRYLVLALVVVIIGGMGSVGGAAIGALITGLILSFSGAYFPQLSFSLTFAPMVIILALKPGGLLGRKIT